MAKGDISAEEVSVRFPLALRAVSVRHSSQFKNYHSTEMCSGSEAGSYLRRVDYCITQLKAHGPSRTCNKS